MFNSCIYKATVMHHRFEPKKHRFHYNLFMFYIDLDEINLLKNKLLLFSYNRFNFFSFRDDEHLQLPIKSPDKSKNTKQHIIDYLNSNEIATDKIKIMLLTNLNVFGYNFNPVSIYFCFDKKGMPLCSIAEVGNTFGEMKPFLLKAENLINNCFLLNTTKYFYVSPFIDLDTNFDFRLTIPDANLNIKIDDYKNEKRFFISTLTGVKKPLNNFYLLLYSLRFPFITLRIISLIHWNAILIWIKKIPYNSKNSNPDLQQNVFKRKN